MTQVATISTTNWIITIAALLVIITLDFAWAVARREKDTSAIHDCSFSPRFR
jgi:steroid 5-alpha reductase family enzyme